MSRRQLGCALSIAISLSAVQPLPGPQAAEPVTKNDIETLRSLLGPKGSVRSFEDASANFVTLKPIFEKILYELNECRPRRESNYNVIWADQGSGGDPNPIHCSRGGDDKPLSQIYLLLRRSNTLGTSYSASNDQLTLGTATFIMFRVGLSTAGSSAWIQYDAEAASCAPRTVHADAITLSRRALTFAPCHWFWGQDSE